MPQDTSVNVWRRQMAAIAARTPVERLAEWEQLNTAAAAMEVSAVRRRHPGYTDREVTLALMRLHHGDELVRAACPDDHLVDP